jgi:hypothetical protein
MSEQVPDPAPGARFSHVYGQRGEPTQDSERVRYRIGATIQSRILHHDRKVNEFVEWKIGITAPWTKSWAVFLMEIDLKDVLDLITVFADYLRGVRPNGEVVARGWLVEIDQIFREENVHYRTEPKGGVRFYIDENFAQARSSVIAALSGARYSNALAEFEKGMAALAQAPPDGKGAIRGVSGAAEALFRLMTSKPRLGAAESDALSPILQRVYAQQVTALRSAQKMLESFKGWIDAAHFYRHEEGVEEPSQPPLQLATYLVGSGSMHLRWLAELDSQHSI